MPDDVYKFDLIVDRRGTACEKYDGMQRVFQRDSLFPMWVADMDFLSPPSVIQAIEKRAAHGVYGYSFADEACRRAVCSWLQRRHQWHVQTDDLVFSPGVVAALQFAIQAFSSEGEQVVVQTPVYFPFYSTVEDNNRILVRSPLVWQQGRYQVDFDHLEQCLKSARLLLLCSPHNPGGSVWRAEELQKIIDLCECYDVTIISDEIHADLVYQPNKHIPTASLSKEAAERTVTLMSASKTFNLAGLKEAYLVIPNHRLKRLYQKVIHKYHFGEGNLFGNLALEAAYNTGADWLEQLLQYMEATIEQVILKVNDSGVPIGLEKPQGTYLLWMDCSKLAYTENELNHLLFDRAKVALSHGSLFGQEGMGFQRMNIAAPREQVMAAVDRIIAAVRG